MRLLLLLALLCSWRGVLAEYGECDTCRYTFGYAYEFVSGRNFAIQRNSDRTYFPANGLLLSDCCCCCWCPGNDGMTVMHAHTRQG